MNELIMLNSFSRPVLSPIAWYKHEKCSNTLSYYDNDYYNNNNNNNNNFICIALFIQKEM